MLGCRKLSFAGPNLNHCTDLLSFSLIFILAYLLVGIPTLYRQHDNETAIYVIDTIKSFIEPLTPVQLERIQFLVILTDLDPSRKKFMYDIVKNKFTEELNSGLINIISIPQRFYPNLYDIPSTLNDGPTRMYWRGKQSLDYSFIATYAHNTCQYFMQTEDDAVPDKNYFNIISKDISEKSAKRGKLAYPWQYDTVPWLCLEYMNMGYIGIVFPDSTLPFMAHFAKLFYGGYPVDLTMRFIGGSIGVLQYQQKEIFVHHGHLSSSKGTV